MSWEYLQKLFKGTYMTKSYYSDKDKDFCDLKLCQMTMDQFSTKFSHLL